MVTTNEDLSKHSPQYLFTGMIGFLLASLAGIFGAYIIYKLNLFRPFLNSIPGEQPLIRLYAGIVFTFLGVGIGGSINGLLRVYKLHVGGSYQIRR